jgi:hypothetical protein
MFCAKHVNYLYRDHVFFQANYKQVINEMLLLACQAVKNYLHALVENVGCYLN